MITRQNLLTFIPIVNYCINLNHLRLIIHDHTLLESHDTFRKSVKKFIRIYPKLTSFIVEFPKRYEGLFRLRNQLQALFESTINKRIYVYPTLHDYACRFCFDTNFSNDEDDNGSDQIDSSQNYRTFCGIPLYHVKKQR